MTGVMKLLYEQSFSASSVIVVNHGLGAIRTLDVQVIVDAEVVLDFVVKALSNNSLEVTLPAAVSGRVQVFMQSTLQVSFPDPNGPLIKLDAANGAGNSGWQYVMGTEFRMLLNADITELHLKFGVGGVNLQHAWTLRRSTVVGAAQPAMTTFTDVIRTGVHTQTQSLWEPVGFGAPHSAVADEWYMATAYVGSGGQSANLNALRTAGQANEVLAQMQGGVYIFDGGANPGPNPNTIPTTRVAGTVYGVVSPELSV